MGKPPGGRSQCIVGDHLSLRNFSPAAGAVMIVIAYWALHIPGLEQWYTWLDAVLHAAVVTVSVQFVIYIGAWVRPAPAYAWELVGRCGTKALNWFASWWRRHVTITGGIRIRLGHA